MTDASSALRTAAVAAIRAKLTAVGTYGTVANRVLINPDESHALPYAAITGVSAISFPTKTTEGMEATISFTCWDDSYSGAETLANYVLQALTDRTSPLSVTGFTHAFAELDFRDTPLREDNEPDGTYWGVPLRVRYRLVQA